jgi:hypothetical protein
MKESGFFDGVKQARVPWRDTLVFSPTFYQDVRMLTAMFMAPLEGVRALLPSKRLHPYRPTPRQSVVYISAYEYRASDIGPYNELGISIPVSLDRPSPVFTGLLWPAPAEPDGYVLHLPVTTEIACALGIESGAYPKFLADIEFKEEGDWVSCRLSEAGQHILTLAVRKGQLRPVPRRRLWPINASAGRLLRSLSIMAERQEHGRCKARAGRSPDCAEAPGPAPGPDGGVPVHAQLADHPDGDRGEFPRLIFRGGPQGRVQVSEFVTPGEAKHLGSA